MTKLHAEWPPELTDNSSMPSPEDIAKAQYVIIDRSRYVKSYECWQCKERIKTGSPAYLIRDNINFNSGMACAYYLYVHVVCYTALKVSTRING